MMMIMMTMMMTRRRTKNVDNDQMHTFRTSATVYFLYENPFFRNDAKLSTSSRKLKSSHLDEDFYPIGILSYAMR